MSDPVEGAWVLPQLRRDQRDIMRHPARVKVVANGRRYGKTTMAGAVACNAARRGARVAWVVPTYKNARPVWRWIERATAGPRSTGAVLMNRTERFLEVPSTGGFLGVYSADNDVGIRGESFHLAVLEEAARIGETTWTEVVQPALADFDGYAILISTPMGRNWFWQEWQRGIGKMDAEQAAFSAPSYANPMPSIRRAYDLAKTRVPDNVFRQEWDAEFVQGAFDTFEPEWFKERRFDHANQGHVNACVARWISWDTGFKDKDAERTGSDPAYTACVVAELTQDYRLFIREVWRDRLTFPNLMAQMEKMARRYNDDGKLKGVVIEDKASGISALQTIQETGEPWLADIVVPFQPQGSKEQRAELAAVWCKQGCVWLPYPGDTAPWLYAFEDELFRFPAGNFKDQVDAFSQLVLYTSRWLSVGRDLRAEAARQADATLEDAA